MSYDNILVKIYGNLWPIAAQQADTLQEQLTPCFPESPHMEFEEMLVIEGDLLRISYEGIYFPIDEVLLTLTPFLHDGSQGKVDYIDIEAWTLTRHTIQGKSLCSTTVPLNSVLDFSGY